MYKGTQSNTSAARTALSARNAGGHDCTARRQHAKGSHWSYFREGCRFIEAGADSWCEDSWCPKHTRYPGRGVSWERIDQTAKEFPYGKTQLFLKRKKKLNLFFPFCPTNTKYWSRFFFEVLLTMHLSITLANEQLDAQIFNTFITIPYMFWAISCSSSGGQIVLIHHLVSSLSVSERPVNGLRNNCSFFSTCALDGHWELWYQMLY